jgi:hypothetical protein
VAAAVAHLVVALLSGTLALAAGCERADDASDVASAGADSTGTSEASSTTNASTTGATANSSASSTDASSTDADADAESDTAGSTSEPMLECLRKLYPASQVLETDVFPLELNGPAELATLNGIRCVSGGIVIRSVTDLAPARNLERVYSLGIVDNPGLRHLDEISALRLVGSIEVDRNPDLENLDGLEGLEVAEFISIGFDDFSFDVGTKAHGNDALRRLPSFVNLTTPVLDFAVADNEVLVDLGSPPTAVVRNLWIMNNESLPFLSARSWADEVQPLDFELVCGNLDDPTPLCEPPLIPD